jgi:hypothetical protein
MIGLYAIIAHYGTIIRYAYTYYCTYYCSYYGNGFLFYAIIAPIIRYYSLLLYAIIFHWFSYYSLLWQGVGPSKMGMCRQQFLTQSWRNDWSVLTICRSCRHTSSCSSDREIAMISLRRPAHPNSRSRSTNVSTDRTAARVSALAQWRADAAVRAVHVRAVIVRVMNV